MKKFALSLLLIGLQCLMNAQQDFGCGHRHSRLLPPPPTDPANLRSDTVDVIKYTLDLNMTQIFSSLLKASCRVDFKAKMNGVDRLTLDLLNYTVDSVTTENTLLLFDYISPLLVIHLPQSLNENETSSLTVHYHGNPPHDASWGGFYISAGYAFNLGVGFDADPHPFGRALFPCFDNFIERSAYEFHVLTSGGKTAYCNGLRTGVQEVGTDSLLTHWSLTDEIPSYLASVAVGSYTHVQQWFASTNGWDIPIWLAAKASDTTAFKNSLVNLVPCLHGFESRYGPYRFGRVGYCAVPFSGGAMEHATNIAYPLFAINGNLTYETLYAHELAHMWWGDNTTCRTQEDMWLNEGWATFSESLFTEWVYGAKAYRNSARNRHKDVLLRAHIQDGERLPVSGIGHSHTYSSHVYKKGADVAHSLRGYMGDEAFFQGTADFQQQFTMSDVNSYDLRDFLQTYTTADLTAFFDNWVFAQGFPEFRLLHTQQNETGVQLTIAQHTHYAPQLYSNVPLKVRLLSDAGNTIDTTVVMTTPTQEHLLNLPPGFTLAHAVLNPDDDILQAVLGEEKYLKDLPTDDFDYAEMDIDVVSLGGADSLWMRVENHFAAANEPAFIPLTDFFISPDRWWFVQGAWSQDANIKGTIRFYGNSGSNNYYDPQFFQWLSTNGYTENDLLLLYRPDGISPWSEWSDYTVNTQGSATNWTGRIDINHLQPGWYAWAVHTGVVQVAETETCAALKAWFAGDDLHVLVPGIGRLQIRDAAGREVMNTLVNQKAEIQGNHWPAGLYLVNWVSQGNTLHTKLLKP